MTQASADLNKLILELRAKTGAGMMDCKKALAESGGSLDAALTALRKKGLADAAKKSARVTKEGLVAFARDGSGGDQRAGALIELGCETDFVARLDEFKALAGEFALRAARGELKSPDDARAAIQPAIQKLGENIVLRRLARLELGGPGLIGGYIHLDGKKGAMVHVEAPSAAQAGRPELAELAKELLLQIVAMSPRYLNRSAVPADELAREREIYTEVLRKEGKPEAQIPKIVEGKVNKLYYQAQCLLEQLSVRDNKTPVSSLVSAAAQKLGGPVQVIGFIRYQLGE